MIRAPELKYFFEVMERNKFDVYLSSHRPFNLNIVGWRFRNTKVDTFEDLLCVYWPLGSTVWQSYAWPITTRPGKHYLHNPISSKGTAILAPGQYLGAYTLGQFKGYTALKQERPIKVFRDRNRDDKFDLDPATLEEGMFGIHIHRAGILSKVVGNWSAGCQVFQKKEDFDTFIALCKQAERHWGKYFTYTLLEI